MTRVQRETCQDNQVRYNHAVRISARALLIPACIFLAAPLMWEKASAQIYAEIRSVVFSEDLDTAVITFDRYLAGTKIPIAFDIFLRGKKVSKGGKVVAAREKARIAGFRQIFNNFDDGTVLSIKFAVCPEENFKDKKKHGITSACGPSYEVRIRSSSEKFAEKCVIRRTKVVGTVYTFEVIDGKTGEPDDECTIEQYNISSFPANTAQVLEVTTNSILVRTIPSTSFYLFVQRDDQTISYYEPGPTGTAPPLLR
jgi:hypothetical protein